MATSLLGLRCTTTIWVIFLALYDSAATALVLLKVSPSRSLAPVLRSQIITDHFDVNMSNCKAIFV